MALFMDSDFSLLKPNQQKDMVDFKVLFEEQDHSKREFLNLLLWFILHPWKRSVFN